MVIFHTNYWVVYVAQPSLAHAKHHWVLQWTEDQEDFLDLSQTAKNEFWELLGQLKARYGLTYYCLGYRGLGEIDVVVGDPQGESTVVYRMI